MKRWIGSIQFLLIGVIGSLFLSGCSGNFMVLDPAGPVGQTEKHLIILTAIWCAVISIPVFILLVYIVYRYRDKEGNDAPYQPDWNDSKVLEVVWWGIPIIIIAVIGTYTARATYSLSKPPEQKASEKPYTVQVMSLDWKWYFQYPDDKVASVNHLVIPTGRPVQFIITADSPMNSFWIPQLGGQEYAMPGMAMQLWLQADKSGTYYGTGANFTGTGFAHMQFPVEAMAQDDFNKWVQKTKGTQPSLTAADFDHLIQQSVTKEMFFSSYPSDAWEKTLAKNGGHEMKMNPDVVNGDQKNPTVSPSDLHKGMRMIK